MVNKTKKPQFFRLGFRIMGLVCHDFHGSYPLYGLSRFGWLALDALVCQVLLDSQFLLGSSSACWLAGKSWFVTFGMARIEHLVFHPLYSSQWPSGISSG